MTGSFENKLKLSLKGCRNVEDFNCLNRIEEGTFGVVYRARDKKTGNTLNCLFSQIKQVFNFGVVYRARDKKRVLL